MKSRCYCGLHNKIMEKRQSVCKGCDAPRVCFYNGTKWIQGSTVNRCERNGKVGLWGCLWLKNHCSCLGCRGWSRGWLWFQFYAWEILDRNPVNRDGRNTWPLCTVYCVLWVILTSLELRCSVFTYAIEDDWLLPVEFLWTKEYQGLPSAWQRKVGVEGNASLF